MSPHIEKIIPRMFMYSGIESSGGTFEACGSTGLYLKSVDTISIFLYLIKGLPDDLARTFQIHTVHDDQLR